MAQRFGSAASTDGATTLYKISKWHAFFLFPSRNKEPGVPCIDEDAFLRAIFLLTLDPPPYLSPQFSSVSHSTSSGDWGRYSGRLITNRGKDAADFSRRIFRSLADSKDFITDDETVIQVPRFIMYQPGLESESTNSNSEEELGQQIIVVEHEKEISIDVRDIVSECAPGWDDRMTANPLREAYKLVPPSLPAQPYDLTNHQVPIAELLKLLKLFQAIDHPDDCDEQEMLSSIINSVERLKSGGKIDWESFKSLVIRHEELIAECLSNIFLAYSKPK